MEIKVMSDLEIEADREKYIASNKDPRFTMDKQYEWIFTRDKYVDNGCGIDAQYFIQDIWGARKVFERKPLVHYDVGSSLSGFVAHLLSFKQKVVVIDVRSFPDVLNSKFLNCENQSGVEYITADATNMDNISSNSIESLSALCSIEHFGLGRYGDPINPSAWEEALKSFSRVIMRGGGALFERSCRKKR